MTTVPSDVMEVESCAALCLGSLTPSFTCAASQQSTSARSVLVPSGRRGVRFKHPLGRARTDRFDGDAKVRGMLDSHAYEFAGVVEFDDLGYCPRALACVFLGAIRFMTTINGIPPPTAGEDRQSPDRNALSAASAGSAAGARPRRAGANARIASVSLWPPKVATPYRSPADRDARPVARPSRTETAPPAVSGPRRASTPHHQRRGSLRVRR